MNFYLIRLKSNPLMYVGKRYITYSLRTDMSLQTSFNHPTHGAVSHGWKTLAEVAGCLENEASAKIWNTAESVKKSLSACTGRQKHPTFDQYEVVIHRTGNDPQCVCATEFYNNWKAYQ